MVWYEDEVKRLEAERLAYTYNPETIFYGSSSIRMWETLYSDFADFKPANLGFGGSTLAACVWYFDRLLLPLNPKQIVFYAGDNDLGDGRHPEEIFIFFQQMMARVQAAYGDIPFAYISVKPSIVRWNLNESIKYTNKLIAGELEKYPNGQYIDIYNSMLNTEGKPKNELFLNDGLHMSAKGYDLWKPAVLNYLSGVVQV
ncbi:GDSL family lipase [Mucilaginibacter sp. HMF5004]|uniref:SGNH/GDSL hydrolase family protein n=1 Tax=Mucilaginibacter rivuli TaxID=2857527 RepID=UPI001C5D19C5|nr:SGNH/GDSL hydrolase family protein [Mucilaginibacter rivuli]MBW4890548.1 GDSL family lipase [Mucilaginibacter rivuli]